LNADEDISEQTIEELLSKGETKTDLLNKELNKIESHFNMNQMQITDKDEDNPNMYVFEGEDYKKKNKKEEIFVP